MVLTKLMTHSIHRELIKSLLQKQLEKKNDQIAFQWISTHCGVVGNEGTDAVTKSAAAMSLIILKEQLQHCYWKSGQQDGEGKLPRRLYSAFNQNH